VKTASRPSAAKFGLGGAGAPGFLLAGCTGLRILANRNLGALRASLQSVTTKGCLSSRACCLALVRLHSESQTVRFARSPHELHSAALEQGIQPE
jgi:hypothetical protein